MLDVVLEAKRLPGPGSERSGRNAVKVALSWHWWFSGRILACHVGGLILIPGQCRAVPFLFFAWSPPPKEKQTTADFGSLPLWPSLNSFFFARFINKCAVLGGVMHVSSAKRQTTSDQRGAQTHNPEIKRLMLYRLT